MGVQNATLLEGATVTSTGGASKTYSSNGVPVQNGITLIDASVTDARTRPTIIVRTIPARVDSAGNWSNDKREITLTRPKVLADGKQRFPNIRITQTTHPENTQAELDELRTMCAQILSDADFVNFWRTGSQA